MHPNVLMKLSSELQAMCHLSKVQLRNFWTWIQMILRIFCGNKGTVHLFPTEYAAFADFSLLRIFWGLELSLPPV